METMLPRIKMFFPFAMNAVFCCFPLCWFCKSGLIRNTQVLIKLDQQIKLLTGKYHFYLKYPQFLREMRRLLLLCSHIHIILSFLPSFFDLQCWQTQQCTQKHYCLCLFLFFFLSILNQAHSIFLLCRC